MLAYHNDPEIKRAVLAQLAAHRIADEIIKGAYWENGKGCAVGCTIHSDNHLDYESRFGIPVGLARFKDVISEGLPNRYTQQWPERFMSAIQPGADLSLAASEFLLWLLQDFLLCKIDEVAFPDCARAIRQVAALLQRRISGAEPAQKEWDAAASAAASAAEAAAEAAGAAWATAWDAAWVPMADKLVEILAAQVPQ